MLLLAYAPRHNFCFLGVFFQLRQIWWRAMVGENVSVLKMNAQMCQTLQVYATFFTSKSSFLDFVKRRELETKPMLSELLMRALVSLQHVLSNQQIAIFAWLFDVDGVHLEKECRNARLPIF